MGRYMYKLACVVGGYVVSVRTDMCIGYIVSM